MKRLFSVFCVLAICVSAHAEKVEKVSDADSQVFLQNVMGAVNAPYSKHNEASARVIEVLCGEGVMAMCGKLVIENGNDEKIFDIGRAEDFRRIVFSGMGELTINTTVTEFHDEGKDKLVPQTLIVKFTQEKSDGDLVIGSTIDLSVKK